MSFLSLCGLSLINFSFFTTRKRKNTDNLWIDNLKTETALFDQMYEISNQIVQYNSTEPETIFIDSHRVMEFSAHEMMHMQNSLRRCRFILELMHMWCSHKSLAIAKTLNFVKVDQLVTLLDDLLTTGQFIDEYLTFLNIKKSLRHLLSVHPLFVVLNEGMYFEPFVSKISKNRLSFVSKIGSGSQANVIEVKDSQNGQKYALKMFDTISECLHEFDILKRIERLMRRDNYSINVPHLVNVYDIMCCEHSAFLMEFIDAQPIAYSMRTENGSFPQNMANRMWDQLSEAIIRLGLEGIGHFDISTTNVLVDKNDNFHLIDFGYGVNVRYDTKPKDLKFPVIGVWAFYPPQAYKLTLLMRDIHNSNQLEITEAQRMQIHHLIVDGNLYSLQALLLASAQLCKQCNKEVGVLHREIEKMWVKSGDLCYEIYGKLAKMWKIRGIAVDNLLKQDVVDHLDMPYDRINKLQTGTIQFYT